MGYVAPSQHAVVVTQLVGPGPSAIHESTRYVPDHTFQEREVARLHEASRGHLLYLGDWHSHPAGALALSRTDRRTLFRIACAPEAGAPRPLMGIFAGGGDRVWRLGIWQAQVIRTWMRRVLRTRELLVVRFESPRPDYSCDTSDSTARVP